MNPIYLTQEEAPEIYKRFGKSPQLTRKGIPEKNWPAWSMKNLRMLLNDSYLSLRSVDQFSEEKPNARPVLVVGEAGIGKSAIMKQTAKAIASAEGREFKFFTNLNDEQRHKYISNPEELDKVYIFLDLRAGELAPEQAQGLPDIAAGQRRGYLSFLPPDWVKAIANPHFSGMVLLDELNRADPSILAQLMRFTLDREIANFKISNRCMVVAAANMGKSFAQPIELDPAQIRRFRGGVLVLDPDEWVAYARANGINSHIIDFARLNPDINMFGRTGEEVISQNIPINPASLEFASDFMKQKEQQYKDHLEKGVPLPPDNSGDIYEDIRIGIAGDLGDKWVDEFMEYLQAIHLFDWAEFVDVGRKGETLKARATKRGEKELSTSKKFALTNWASDEIVARYDMARKKGDKAAVKQLVDEVYYVLFALDLDNVATILKNIIVRIRDNPPEGVSETQAVKDWNDLMVPVFQKAQAENPAFHTKLSNLSKEMKRLADPTISKK